MISAEQIAGIEGACRGYLDLLRSAPVGPRQRHEHLASALDRLCDAFNETSDIEPATAETEAPRIDMKMFGDQASLSFPELQFYPQVDPLGGFEQEIGQGWGLDDFVDIAVDLQEVLWLLDHEHFQDAVWQFRWGYQNHWGHHLHNLRRYLHSLLYWG